MLIYVYIYMYIYTPFQYFLTCLEIVLFVYHVQTAFFFHVHRKRHDRWKKAEGAGPRAWRRSKLRPSNASLLIFFFFTSYAPSKTTRLTAKRLKVWSFHTELASFQKVSWAKQLFQTEVWSIRDLWIFRYLGLGQVFSFPNPEVLVIFRLEHPKFDTTSDY